MPEPELLPVAGSIQASNGELPESAALLPARFEAQEVPAYPAALAGAVWTASVPPGWYFVLAFFAHCGPTVHGPYEFEPPEPV